MNPQKRRELYGKWMDMQANIAKMERTLLELMAHPEATAEQLMEAHHGYVRTIEANKRIRSVLESRRVISWR